MPTVAAVGAVLNTASCNRYPQAGINHGRRGCHLQSKWRGHFEGRNAQATVEKIAMANEISSAGYFRQPDFRHGRHLSSGGQQKRACLKS